MWKRAISPLFHNIFNISLTSRVQLYIYLLNVVNQISFSSILQIWNVEVRISPSISGSPLKFEITRVDCISNCCLLKFLPGMLNINLIILIRLLLFINLKRPRFSKIICLSHPWLFLLNSLTDLSLVVRLVKCPSELQVIQTADSLMTFSASGTKLSISPKPWNRIYYKNFVEVYVAPACYNVKISTRRTSVVIFFSLFRKKKAKNLIPEAKAWQARSHGLLCDKTKYSTCLWKVPSKAATIIIFPLSAIWSQNDTTSGNWNRILNISGMLV